MKRAAIDRAKTLTRWRYHHDNHLRQSGVVTCRCDKQVGRFRKGQKRGGCGKPRCYLCHGEKLLGIPSARTKRIYQEIE